MSSTRQLVVHFHRANGLAVDGIVDVDTWRVMLALPARRPDPTTVAATTT